MVSDSPGGALTSKLPASVALWFMARVEGGPLAHVHRWVTLLSRPRYSRQERLLI